MDQTVVMKYGETAVSIPIRGAHRIETLHENTMREIEDLPAEFARAIGEGAIDSPPLRELAHRLAGELPVSAAVLRGAH